MKFKILLLFFTFGIYFTQGQTFTEKFRIVHSIGQDSRTVYEKYKNDYETYFTHSQFTSYHWVVVIMYDMAIEFFPNDNDNDEIYMVSITSNNRDRMYSWVDYFDVKWKTPSSVDVKNGNKNYRITMIKAGEQYNFTFDIND